MSAQPVTNKHVESLARATLAHGFIQLVTQFPAELDELRLSPEQAIEQALRCAEEAIALAPELPDGHTALGRVILCFEGDEVLQDALEVLRHAVELDQEHDPAQTALATALWREGNPAGALEAIDRVLKRGNALPQPLMLRALIHLDAGRIAAARRDLERAVLLAPQAGVFHLTAAEAAEAAGDETAAQEHRERARLLLDA